MTDEEKDKKKAADDEEEEVKDKKAKKELSDEDKAKKEKEALIAADDTQVGQAVTFTEGDNTYSALIIETRQLDDLAGSEGQPLVHLGFFQQVYKIGPDGEKTVDSVVGTARRYELVQFRYDVAHESQEFDDPEAQPYPGGRWSEKTPTVNPLNFEPVEEEELEPPKKGTTKPSGALAGLDKPQIPPSRPPQPAARPGVAKPTH